jgi:SlyX protein
MQESDRGRIDDLEVRLTHHERTIAELNEIVSEQWRRIDLLERHFTQMREEMRNLVPPNTGEEPPPPHY